MPGPRAAQDLQMPHPRDWYGGQMPRSSPGGGRGWGQLDLLWRPVLRGRGTPDFKLRGCSNADKNQPSPPKKKSIGFLTKPKKSLHKNYPCPLPPKITWQERPCTRAPAPYPNSSVGMLEKRVCWHQCPASTVLWHQVCCITFPRTTKEIGHVCRCAGYLLRWCRIPILIKQNSLLCQHKNWRFLVCCIRRHTDIFRFILIYLIIASYVPQGVMSISSFKQTAESGILSKVVETVLPVKAAKEEVVVEPEDETEVEDNTYVGESRSVITE